MNIQRTAAASAATAQVIIAEIERKRAVNPAMTVDEVLELLRELQAESERIADGRPS